MPIISIILPIYNVASFLPRCLDSLISQGIKDLEFILIDDGSTDNSRLICEHYSRIDSRFRVIYQQNKGVGSARNNGILQAKGTWVSFIDSDDWVEMDYLKDFISRIGTGADLIMQGYVKERGETEIGRRHLIDAVVPGAEIPSYFLENDLLDFGSPCCKLFRRSILLEHGLFFPECYSYGEDTLFFLEYIQYCGSLSCIGREGYHYVENSSESLSQRVHHSLPLLQFIRDNTEVLGAFPATSVWDEIRRRQNAKNVALANRAYINMSKLNYTKEQGLDVIRFFRKEVRPLLHTRGISVHDRGFLALTALPDGLQWAVLTAFRKSGIIHA